MAALRPIQPSVKQVLIFSCGKVARVMPTAHLLLVSDCQCVGAVSLPPSVLHRHVIG